MVFSGRSSDPPRCANTCGRGSESWLIADLLKQNNISVILQQLHALPTTEDDDVDQPFKTPAVLQKAGVDSQLLVYEALPHAFWYHFELPETREALEAMAGFLSAKLGK